MSQGELSNRPASPADTGRPGGGHDLAWSCLWLGRTSRVATNLAGALAGGAAVRACMAALLLAAAAACDGGGGQRAVIAAVEGEVTLRSTRAPAGPATIGQRLRSQDIISTGLSSGATIELLGGQLTISSVTVLSVDSEGRAPVFSLLGGVFRASAARPRVFELLVPLGRLTPVEVPLAVEVDPQSGRVEVTSGALQLDDREGRRRVLRAGTAMIKVEGAPDAQGHTPWRASGVVLLSPGPAVSIRRSSGKTWDAPRREEFIAVGDRVRTAGDAAILQYLSQDQVIIAPHSEVEFPPEPGAEARLDKVRLTRGSVAIRRVCRAGGRAIALLAGQREIAVTCPRSQAHVEVELGPGGAGLLRVHLGAATIDQGPPVRAGWQRLLDDDTRLPIASRAVLAVPDTRTVVFAGSADVPVTFAASRERRGAATSRPQLFQLSRADNFDNLLWEEVVEAREFTVARVPIGSYRFRVRPLEDPLQVVEGSLVIGPAVGAVGDERVRQVNAGPVPQTFFYRAALPAFSLRWPPTAGAAKYRVDVYSTHNLDVPVTSTVATGTQALLEAGTIGEGTYYWYVQALTAEGRELRVSPPYRFSLAYDRAAAAIQLGAPGDGQQVGSPLVVHGSAPRRFQIEVNGDPVERPPSGEVFRRSLELPPGPHLLTVAARDPQVAETYWMLRRVAVRR